MGNSCPSDSQLSSLIEQEGTSADLGCLTAHLDRCEACRGRLDRLAHQSWEGLDGAAREGSKLDETRCDTVLNQAMAGLIENGSKESISLRSTNRSGSRFGEFEIIEEIAKGGMGIVYRARQRNLNRLVALKLLGTGTYVSQDKVARFQTETEAVATIEHPNIVPIYGVGEIDGQPYFSMKLIEGGSLAQRLEELTPASLLKSTLSNRSDILSRQRRVVRIMISICRAIHYTHERGILHRDLKPNNVLMDEHEEPQITDFGLAKILERDSGLTESFAVMGTPSYMAPEQAAGNARQITTAADVYGLGAIFYELLCGVPPFKESTPLATMRRVIDSEPEAPRRLCSMIDADLETVCLKALSKEPERRYENASQMAEDLDRWLLGEPVIARPIGWFEKGWRVACRNPLPTALVGIVCLLVFLIVLGSAAFGLRVSELYQESERLVTGFQLGKAEELLANGDSLTGIAILGRILENDPLNEVAATRLMSALIHRDLAIPKRSPMNHGVAIRDLYVSLDQRHIASLGVDGSVRLWDGGADRASPRPLEESIESIRSLAFDSGGDRLIGGSDSGVIVVWETATGKLLGRQEAHGLSIDTLSVGLGQSRIVTGSRDRTVRLWDLDTGESLSGALVHPGPVLSARMNRRGDQVLTTCGDRAARVWSVGGELIAGPFRHIGPIRGAQFDPLERRLLTYGIGPKAVIWDIEEDRPVTMGIEHKAPIVEARFNPDGRTLVTVGEDGFARVWDAVSGKLLREFTTRKTRIERLQFGPLGRKLLLVSSGGDCQLWDSDGSRLLVNAMKHPDRVGASVFMNDGKTIVTGCDDGKLRTWSVGSYPHWQSLIRHHGPVNDAIFTPDGRGVVTVGQDRMLKMSDVATGKSRFRSRYQRNPIQFVAVSKSGDRILTGERSPRRMAVAALWDALSGGMLIEPVRQRGNLLCGELSPEGEFFVLGGEQGRVSVWRANNDLEPVVDYSHRGPVHTVSFDYSGTRVVSAGNDGKAIVARVLGSEHPEGTIDHTGRVLSAVFHPEDELVLTASSDHLAQLWTLSEGEGKPFGRAFQHEESVNWAEFSHDGSMILTASSDGSVCLWSVTTQERLGSPIIHSGPVAQAHFDQSGEKIIVIGGDNVARIWDVATHRPLTEPFGHSREILGGSMSPDGSHCVIHSADDVARIWQVPVPPLPMPQWFSKFLGCITGFTVDSEGNRQFLDENSLIDIRREVAFLKDADYYEALASWLVSFDEARRLGPVNTETLAAYVESEVAFGSFTSVNMALKYAPMNGAALASHALLLIRDIGGRSARSRQSAAFYSRRATELSPENPIVWSARAEVMRANGWIEAEWEAMSRYLELTEDSASVLWAE